MRSIKFFKGFPFVLEAQPVLSQDKSPWRKSSLNIPNSMEETDPRYSRRLRSRHNTENALVPSTLQVGVNVNLILQDININLIINKEAHIYTHYIPTVYLLYACTMYYYYVLYCSSIKRYTSKFVDIKY